MSRTLGHSPDGGSSSTAPGDVIREPSVSDHFALAASGARQGEAVWASYSADNGVIEAVRLSPLIR